jgi:hypothetical protein
MLPASHIIRGGGPTLQDPRNERMKSRLVLMFSLMETTTESPIPGCGGVGQAVAQSASADGLQADSYYKIKFGIETYRQFQTVIGW